jgi:hypothetical protein
MFVSYKSGRGFVTNSTCKDQMITPQDCTSKSQLFDS